jgi:hypothetical protein
MYVVCIHTTTDCAVCDSGYTRSTGYQCTKCRGTIDSRSIVMIVVVVILMAIAFVYITNYFITSDDEQYESISAVNRSLHKVVQGVKKAPWNKLRIPIVVMQLLTQFMSITGTQFPSIYGDYLKWLDIVDLDISWLLSIGCVLHVNFYAKLLITTIAPPVIVAVVVGALHLRARYIHGPVTAIHDPATPLQRSFRTDALKQATAKHLSAFLTFTFLIYSTVSTVVFQTFACDYFDDTNESWLRADYSISCNTGEHSTYKIYAAVMIAVYPIGIPLLYSALLIYHRHSLNPDRSNGVSRGISTAWSSLTTKNRRAATRNNQQQQLQQQQQDAKTTAATTKPESIRFLWSPYREQVYWWEAAECIRRLALTGLLVFILPGTAGQSAVACVFTVITLIVFSIASPFTDRTDFNHYWLGCMILFLSTILAFILKGNYTATEQTSQEVLPTLLVTLNILLLVSVAIAVAVVARIAYTLSIAALPRTVCAPVGPTIQSQLSPQSLQQQNQQQVQGPRH